MRVEVPQCRRCCCCLPLRYGLIFWGYLKLILIIAYMIYLACMMYLRHTMELPSILMQIVNALDIAFGILFIVAGHMKNHKLLKVYYYYSITEVSIQAILLVLFIVWIAYIVFSGHCGLFCVIIVYYIFNYIVLVLLDFGFQLYIIFLVRSELIKLETDQHSFMFVNDAAEMESACTLVIDADAMENAFLKQNGFAVPTDGDFYGKETV